MQLKFLTDGVLSMIGGANGTNGTTQNGKMRLIDAAILMERLQNRAAHAGEVEALQVARDALLTILAEGYDTLAERLGLPVNGARRPDLG